MNTPNKQAERINLIETELERFKYNEKIRDTIIMICTIIVIVSIIGVNIWMWLS